MPISDEEYWNAIKNERAAEANRVAQYDQQHPMTGNAFMDMNTRYATKTDRKKIAAADEELQKHIANTLANKEIDIKNQLGQGEISVAKQRNDIVSRGQDIEQGIENKKLDLADKSRVDARDYNMGNLGIQKQILADTQARYNKYGEPADQLALASKVESTAANYKDDGIDPGTVFDQFTPTYIGKKDAAPLTDVAKPFEPIYNDVPEPKSPFGNFIDSVQNSDAVRTISQLPKMNPTDIMSQSLSHLFQKPIQNKIRRKVIK